MADEPKTGRLVSLDALRGFDMFFIIGGHEFLLAVSKWLGWSGHDRLATQLEHASWQGFRFYDLIFPLFLFLVGVVLPFSLAKYRADPRAAHWRILRRTLLIVLCGLLYNHVQNLDFANARYAGVLQRIGLCYGVAALFVLHTRVWFQAVAFVGILAGYWAIFTFLAAPGGTPGDYRKATSLAAYIDQHYLPGKLFASYYGDGDNEGLLSTIPAAATALLGVLAGHLLRSTARPGQKVAALAGLGAACVALGYAWCGGKLPPLGEATEADLAGCYWTVPCIKNLWTGSFVLVAGGWSLVLLALFYGVVDVLRWRWWAWFFVVIGANAITIYLGQGIIDFEHASKFFFGGVIKKFEWGEVATTGFELLTKWLFLLLLYKNRVFLRL